MTVLLAGVATPLPASVTTDASGRVHGLITLPTGSTFTADQLRLVAKNAEGQVIPGSTCLLSPVTAAAGSGGGGTDPASTLSAKARSVAEISSELHTGAHYSNLPNGQVPAEEAAELTREAIEDARQLFDPPSAANPPPVNETPGMADFAPVALGGDLAQEAEKGISLVDLAAAINGVVANAATLAHELDTAAVRNETGAQVGKVYLGYSTWDLVSMVWPGGSAALNQAWQDTKADFIDSLTGAAGEALRAAVKAAKAFDDWEKLEQISGDLGVLPYIQDAHVLIETLDEEAFISLIHALARYSATLAKDPGATALATIQTADPWIAGKINAWAQQNGEDAQVIAAAAGLFTQMLQNGAMLAAAAGGPEKAFKRMAGEMLGMVMGAVMGSEEARDELKEMVPFYSWLLLGPKVKTKWEAQDYYGAGKEAWNLTLQVVGDVTMFLPVIKGAAAGIRVVGQELKILFERGMKKRAAGRFGREIRNTWPETPADLARRIDDTAADIPCFPAGSLVLMADGSAKPIEQVRLGDCIMSDNPDDDLPAAARIVDAVYEGSTDRLVTLSFDEDGDGSADLRFRATREHPIWTFNAGWVDASELTAGDRVLDAQRKSMTVTSTSQARVTCDTWNLNVAGDHAFFVGDGTRWVLVHNLNTGPRTWVQYEVEFDLNGKTYFYNGRTSAYGQVDEAWDIFSTKRYRNGFQRTVYEMDPATGLVKKDQSTGKKIAIGEVSFTREELEAMRRNGKIRFEKPQYSDGKNLVTLTDSKGRSKTYSKEELAVRGAEHLKDAARRRQGKSANDNVPLRGHPAIDEFKNAANKVFTLPPRTKC